MFRVQDASAAHRALDSNLRMTIRIIEPGAKRNLNIPVTGLSAATGSSSRVPNYNNRGALLRGIAQGRRLTRSDHVHRITPIGSSHWRVGSDRWNGRSPVCELWPGRLRCAAGAEAAAGSAARPIPIVPCGNRFAAATQRAGDLRPPLECGYPASAPRLLAVS
jgi:hypothetical protein